MQGFFFLLFFFFAAQISQISSSVLWGGGGGGAWKAAIATTKPQKIAICIEEVCNRLCAWNFSPVTHFILALLFNAGETGINLFKKVKCLSHWQLNHIDKLLVKALILHLFRWSWNQWCTVPVPAHAYTRFCWPSGKGHKNKNKSVLMKKKKTQGSYFQNRNYVMWYKSKVCIYNKKRLDFCCWYLCQSQNYFLLNQIELDFIGATAKKTTTLLPVQSKQSPTLSLSN